MKTAPLHCFIITVLALGSLCAADDSRLATIRAADDERVVAVLAADRPRLTAILSDDLHYGHSNGIVEDKTTYTDVIAIGRTKYFTFDYEERNFTFPAPGIALMTGRVRTKGANASGPADNTLNFLAVWREENGKWRFLAWQSCKLAPPVPAAK